jgi:CDP-diacylglycerol--glycerol-3-phosphate 3-phosphatidyltransferase
MGAEKSSGEWEIDNLPNRLTLFRVAMVPVVIGCLYVNILPFEWASNKGEIFGWIACWTFVAASITDFFDGWIARRRNIVTVFGSFLDPIADKFLVVSSLLMLQALERIPAIIVVILVLREFYITSLRLLAKERGISIPVSEIGKWKTAMQMVGIPFLMAYTKPWGIPMGLIGSILMYGSSIISLYSAFDYTFHLFIKIKELRKQKKAQKRAQVRNLHDDTPRGSSNE